MSRTRAPAAVQEQARQVVRHLLGVSSIQAIVLVVGLLVGLGWLTTSLYEWLVDLGRWLAGETVDTWWPLHRLIAVVVSLTQIVVLFLLARGARRHYRPRVEDEPNPPPVHGLILFLSNLTMADAKTLDAALEGIRDLADFRARFGKLNWRMPVEAIAYHRSRLEHVIAICSRAQPNAGEAERPGSAGQMALFAKLVARLFPGAEFILRDSAHLDSRYTGGVDFEDVESVSAVADRAFADLAQRGLPTPEILIDVTGGQKPTAVAATAVALAEGRRIQYVVCKDDTYRPKVYDVTYEQ